MAPDIANKSSDASNGRRINDKWKPIQGLEDWKTAGQGEEERRRGEEWRERQAAWGCVWPSSKAPKYSVNIWLSLPTHILSSTINKTG